MSTAAQPFFSIGLTTYDRPEFLRATLDGILAQSEGDFEVLIGNDHPAGPVTAATLGTDDPRVRIFNHPVNLGERGNMNHLLAEARGRYFSWMGDDDGYAPGCFAAVRQTLARCEYPPALFTDYAFILGEAPPPPVARGAAGRLMTGPELLRRWSLRELRTMACCGFFDTQALRDLGGMPPVVATPVALYSEYLLLGRACAAWPRVAFIASPLVYYRIHPGSWGVSNLDLELYHRAGIRLLEEFIALLRWPEFSADFRFDFAAVLRLTLRELLDKQVKSGGARPREIFAFLREAIEATRALAGEPHERTARSAIRREGLAFLRQACKQRLGAHLPDAAFKPWRVVRRLVAGWEWD